jgi:hypothetical protein
MAVGDGSSCCARDWAKSIRAGNPFWAAQRFKVAGWDDLQAAFENASGEKLGVFFAPWLNQQALPDIAIARAESAPHGKQHLLTITFSKQDAKLPLRLPLEIRGAGKAQTHWVDLAANSNSATLKLAFQPQSLRLTRKCASGACWKPANCRRFCASGWLPVRHS